MKYSNLIIAGLPKSFDVGFATDYIQPLSDDASPEDVVYDIYPAECNEENGEGAVVLFKYNESATGVYLVHTPHLQALAVPGYAVGEAGRAPLHRDGCDA